VLSNSAYVHGRVRAMSRVALCAAAALVLMVLVAPAARAVTIGPLPTVGPAGLPDNRGYEMVSPVDKDGGDISESPISSRTTVDGNTAQFSSNNAFGEQGSSYGSNGYIATRVGPGEWTTHYITPTETEYVTGYSSDLLQGTLLAETPLTPDAPPELNEHRSLYERRADGSVEFLAADGAFADASADFSHVVFETDKSLLPGAPEGVAANLYEKVGGQLRLVSVLPNGEPAPEGGFAGSVVDSHGYGLIGGATSGYPTQNTISEDGSLIFWGDAEHQQLYMRVNGTRTVQISAPQRPVKGPDPAGSLPAEFLGATPSGSKVLFISGEKLTEDSTAGGEEVPDLYIYDTSSGTLKDLSVDPNSGEAADVRGIAGMSSDGSFVYFVATGVLAAGAQAGGENVYLSHNGEVSYITTLSGEGGDFEDRSPLGGGTAPRLARVSPNGRFMVLTSRVALTPYETNGHSELYRYDADTAELDCISCNPSGAPATGDAGLYHHTYFTPIVPDFLTRPISESGAVFFDSSEALVPADSNGQSDVYEWENGQLSLLSGGQSSSGSYFGDASPDGSNVFLITRQQLVEKDVDTNTDMYDARVDGGTPKQPTPPACTGTGCQGVPPSQPIFATPSSVTFAGVGNFAAPAPKATVKKKTVKKKTTKKAKSKKVKKGPKAKSKHTKRAKKSNSSRRAGR
jgi:hypothetical protein